MCGTKVYPKGHGTDPPSQKNLPRGVQLPLVSPYVRVPPILRPTEGPTGEAMSPSFTVAPDGTVTPYPPANGTHFTLEEMQTAVGGYVQTVGMADGRLMIVHEDGLLIGLPRNAMASAHYGEGANIVGTILVCPSSMLR